MDINNITGVLRQGGDSWSIAQVASHLASTSNPHSVTATQVGLGSVSNYEVADQSTAEAGESNSVYMTPLRVAQYFATQDTLTDLVGGDGIDFNSGTSTISVNVDGSTIEISADALRLKDDGVTGAKLAPAVAGAGLVQDGSGNLDVGAGTNISVAADSVAVVNNPTFSGLVTTSAGLTVADGQVFTLNAVGLDAVSTSSAGSGLDNGTIWTGQAIKEYIDSVAQGLDAKDSVDVATTANITLSGEQTIDGVLTSGSRVLVKDQSTASQNGIYVSAAGAWSRATDMDAGAEVPGAFIPVEVGGTQNGGTLWLCTNSAAPTLGTDSVGFTQVNGASNVVAGDGLAKSGNTLSVNTAGGLEISSDNVQIADGGVSTAKIADDSVTGAKLAPAVAGDGLAQDGSGNLDVQADNVTIEITANALNVKADSIGQSLIDFSTLAASAAQVKAGSASEVFIEPQDALVINASDATNSVHSRSATASGNYSAAFGRGTASGADSAAAGQATASGLNSAAFGASATTASGDYALAAGAAVASGDYAVAFGNATASRYGEVAVGKGDYSAQRSVGLSLTNVTSNTTETELYLDGTAASERLVLDNNTAWTYVATVQGVNVSDINERLVYVVEGTCERGVNAAATEVSATTNTRILRDDDANWDFAISADTTNGSLKFTGTGVNGKTVRWSADVMLTQLKVA